MVSLNERSNFTKQGGHLGQRLTIFHCCINEGTLLPSRFTQERERCCQWVQITAKGMARRTFQRMVGRTVQGTDKRKEQIKMESVQRMFERTVQRTAQGTVQRMVQLNDPRSNERSNERFKGRSNKISTERCKERS